MNSSFQRLDELWRIGLATLKELETEDGVLASARNESYNAIFGRDSLITGLRLVSVYERTRDRYFLELTRKVLTHLVRLQGTTVNIESGEEPGKCIHEYRPTGHEPLTTREKNPWYLYPDGVMRNYDSVDATPLMLIALYRYYTVSRDESFFKEVLPHIKAACDWVLTYGDHNHDGFIDYVFPRERRFGGLVAQGWMDSPESVFHEEGGVVPYPIAPVEVQAYTYLALKAWGAFFTRTDPPLGRTLTERAASLKTVFNRTFVLAKEDELSLAFALDGNGRPLVSARSNMGHCLWATWKAGMNAAPETILNQEYLPRLVQRLLALDLFEPRAGIRTLSMDSRQFDASSYHNGSLWPHDTSIVAQGLDNIGYHEEAARVRRALLSAIDFFKTPIELFTYNQGTFAEFLSPQGVPGNKKQAWSAASLLADIATLRSL